jgi:hypothetical protein
VRAGNSHEATGNSGKLKVFGFALYALLFVFSVPVDAQQQDKIAKIGELDLRAGSTIGPVASSSADRFASSAT